MAQISFPTGHREGMAAKATIRRYPDGRFWFAALDIIGKRPAPHQDDEFTLYLNDPADLDPIIEQATALRDLMREVMSASRDTPVLSPITTEVQMPRPLDEVAEEPEPKCESCGDTGDCATCGGAGGGDGAYRCPNCIDGRCRKCPTGRDQERAEQHAEDHHTDGAPVG